MKKISKFRCLIFPASIIVGAIFLSNGFTQDIAVTSSGPQSPPVDIVFSAENTPIVGQELTLKLKVTPREDMHVDISCLLPEGIESVREEGLMVRPYMDREWHRRERWIRYMEVVELWIGPLEGGITKEFSFRMVIPDKERYELIAHVEALAKWGAKEKILVIDIE